MDFSNAIKSMTDCMNAIDKIPTHELKLATLCTLFDYICEGEKLDKMQTLDTMYSMIKNMNAECGDVGNWERKGV